MIRQLCAGLTLLTRLPVRTRSACTMEDVARSMRWFPVIGGFIGLFYAGTAWLCGLRFPPFVVATLIVVVEALLTGGLHFDGLADTADGFGGGRMREDVLRIMRDHAVGAYGVIAVALAIALKITTVGALIERQSSLPYLVIAPALGRWASVLAAAALPYARSEEDGLPNMVGRVEAIVASVLAILIAAGLARWRGLVACALVAGVTASWCAMCHRRIGGVTGDTLGAITEVSELFVYLLALGW